MGSKRILLALFFAVIFLFPIVSFIVPDKTFSELENRALKSAPAFSADAVLDKSFMNGTESYLADHIVLRDAIAKAKSAIDLAVGKRELGGAYVCDDKLVEHIAKPDETVTALNAEEINKFAQKYRGKIDTTMMLVPTAETIYSATLPMAAPYIDQTAYIKSFYDSLQNVNTVDAYAVLSAHQKDYIYYRTDHHWTSYGAYLGYTALAKPLNLKAVPHDMFNIEHVANDFLGTLYSKALCHEDFADTIDLYAYSQGDPVNEVVRHMGKNTQTYSSIFFRENLEGKDKYTVFLGQNTPVVTINTNVKNGKKLIVFKDSYANSMMQFLTLHYEQIAVVDLRYLNVPLSDYVDINDYQQALFLYNVGTFTSDQSMRKLAGC